MIAEFVATKVACRASWLSYAAADPVHNSRRCLPWVRQLCLIHVGHELRVPAVRHSALTAVCSSFERASMEKLCGILDTPILCVDFGSPRRRAFGVSSAGWPWSSGAIAFRHATYPGVSSSGQMDERSAGHIRDWRHRPLLRSRLMERSAKCQRPNRTKMVIFSFVFARASPDPSLATVQYKVRAWNCPYT